MFRIPFERRPMDASVAVDRCIFVNRTGVCPVDKSWIDIDAVSLFEKATGCQVAVLNDADAAGYAELMFGAARELSQRGVVLMTTFGTGIGTAMFVDGALVRTSILSYVLAVGCRSRQLAMTPTSRGLP